MIIPSYISTVRVLFVFSASAIFFAPPAPMVFFCKLNHGIHETDVNDIIIFKSTDTFNG